MAGERLERAVVSQNGIEGDRIVHAQGGRGRLLTARTRPGLLRHRAVLGPDGEPLVDGRAWHSEAVARDVEQAAGPGTRLVRYDGPERFDILPLLVATDGAIQATGEDRRRFRPNLIVGGVPGLEERKWEGRKLRIGSCLIQAHDLRGRCIMTTFHPDTVAQDVGVLRRIQQEFGGVLGLNCSVVEGGVIAVGDPVELV
jgi:uncharacterized protein YcbX